MVGGSFSVRRFLPTLTVLALLVALLLAGCGGGPVPGGAAGTGSSESADLKEVSLILDWYPNAVHTFILAAEEQGFFADEGLAVTLKMPAENPTDGVKLVGAGKETFALYYAPEVLRARSEGIPIVSAAALVRRSLDGIMTKADSGINSPADLVGKSVGYPSVALNVQMVETMVRYAGGDPGRVTLTDVSWDLMPALATDQVDAIIGAYVNHEQPLLEKQGYDITYFAPLAYGVPNYYELVLITGEATAAEAPDTVAAMVRAFRRGMDWVQADPAAALALLLDQQNIEFPLDPEIEEQSLAMLLPWMVSEDQPFGRQEAADWDELAAWLAGEGLIDPALEPADAWFNID